jgi:hypothetical protein
MYDIYASRFIRLSIKYFEMNIFLKNKIKKLFLSTYFCSKYQKNIENSPEDSIHLLSRKNKIIASVNLRNCETRSGHIKTGCSTQEQPEVKSLQM